MIRAEEKTEELVNQIVPHKRVSWKLLRLSYFIFVQVEMDFDDEGPPQKNYVYNAI